MKPYHCAHIAMWYWRASPDKDAYAKYVVYIIASRGKKRASGTLTERVFHGSRQLF